MNRFTLLHFEWNCINDFIIQLCGLDINRDYWDERALFGLYISRDFFYVEFLFVYFNIWNKVNPPRG